MTDIKNSVLAKGFATDKQAEADGLWKTHPETGVRVKLRRTTHALYKAALRRHFKKIRHLGANVPPELENDVKFRAAADGMVTDWEVPGVPYSNENVLAAFKEFPDFYDWCEEEAGSFENYRLQAVEEDAGPLSPSSDGPANGAIPQSSPSSNDGPLGGTL